MPLKLYLRVPRHQNQRSQSTMRNAPFPLPLERKLSSLKKQLQRKRKNTNAFALHQNLRLMRKHQMLRKYSCRKKNRQRSMNAKKALLRT